ncbi:MAG: GNAT family N-acetyltransferase [Bacteroidota bacterium]
MPKNPFASPTFISKWLESFEPNSKAISFPGISGVRFTKGPWPFTWVNVGKNLTKGIFYSLENRMFSRLGNKVLLIYDVPTYSEESIAPLKKDIGRHRIKQYPGYRLNLETFTSLDDYMKSISKARRNKLRKYCVRLEHSCDISYRMYHGAIGKKEYDTLFTHFNELLEKRFSDKKEHNHNLDPKEWAFYRKMAYPMIKEKRAALFVIYDKKVPIGIALTYVHRKGLLGGITTFDIAYSSFNLGSVLLLKQVEWCLREDFEFFDFSKGDYEYKRRWGNLTYDFEYHLIYDKKKILPATIACAIKWYLKLKQLLRENEVHTLFHRLVYRLAPKETKSRARQKGKIELLDDLSDKIWPDEWISVEKTSQEFKALRPLIYHLLFSHQEKYTDITVFGIEKDPGLFLLKGLNFLKMARLQQ